MSHLSDEQLSRLIDGDVSAQTREAMNAHMSDCHQCAERHDQMIKTVATLRLSPPMRWRQDLTEATLARVTDTSTEDRSLPVSTLIALTGVTACTLVAPLLHTGLAIGSVIYAAVDQLGPNIPLTTPSATLLALIVLAILAPLAAFPLARWR